MIMKSPLSSIPIGLYQHFKGDYYFLMDFSRDSDKNCGEIVCRYMNIFHPEYGTFICSAKNWFSDVYDREDNVTGQHTRFSPIGNFNKLSLEQVSTPDLIKELLSRKDFNDYTCSEYACGIQEPDENGVIGVHQVGGIYLSEEEMQNYYLRVQHHEEIHPFRIVYIPLK